MFSSPTMLRLGTRQSPLAMAQAAIVRAALLAVHPGLEVAVIPMTTSGDSFLDGPLADIGGKGLFTKEIEEALLAGGIDIAVHSAKDMQTQLPAGLILAACLKREDARDVLIGPYASMEALPEGAVLGTSSLRRMAQARRLRPDIRIVDFRGNVQTRLKKLAVGQADATLLALAGLKRLQLDPLPGTPQPISAFLPAVAQGAIGLECRENDVRIRALLEPLNHADTLAAITCERALLAALDGSCRTPIAGYAEVSGGNIHLRAMLAAPDGSDCRFAEGEGRKPEILGREVAEALK